jgi:hypothetical protein
MDGARLGLSGDGERIDGLRALCAAAWTQGAADSVSEEAVRPAIERLERTDTSM